MVFTKKFSDFASANINTSTNAFVGISSLTGGINIKSPFVNTWTTVLRPLTPFDGLLGYNTTLHEYEFWNGLTSAWVQLVPSTATGTAASKNATDNALPNVSSAKGAFTIGHVLVAADAAGTVEDGGSPAGMGTVLSVTAGLGLTGGVITTTGTIALDVPVTVNHGGTGNTTFTAYSVLCAGTTATGAFQNVSGVGSASQVLVSNGAAALPSWQSVPGLTPAALTKIDDTNVTLSLGGTPATALLQSVSLTLGWTGQLGPTRGGTGIGTYLLGDTLYSSAANTLAKLSGNTTAVKQYLSQTGDGVNSASPLWATISGSDITGDALTKTDDTNVTLTLGGTPATALLRAASLTLGWTGTLSGTRGGTGVNNGSSTATYAGNLVFAAAFTTSGAFAVTQTYTGITNVTFPTSGTLATTAQIPTGAALTKTDDTNVTLTLGGTPSTALLQASSLTLGWTGTLSGTRGGTGVNNGSSTITLGGNFTTSGAFTTTLTVTGNTNVTLPTSGTLSTTTGTVTSVATAGLATGGTITSTGTVTVTAATKSDENTGTSTTTASVPANHYNNAAGIKCWGSINNNGSSATIADSFNLTSVNRTGTGVIDVVMSKSMDNTTYGVMMQMANNTFGFCKVSVTAANTFTMTTVNTAGSALDIGIYFAVIAHCGT